ncbi:short chain dehydrogenase reductase family [Colletotrichum chrysophilum]|uniref:Short chain dehydrogenase reductase family n=1 Tax=Colletotrichum chrysophilum TaxID=1836956 RepID=A0AAD9A8H4_9PEZI|nr:short chain dehydrogenase reductase family [Colletotrichum chrysophilum]
MSQGNNSGGQCHVDAIKGARVLIIGGSAGIGKGVASAALAAGANVFVSSSNPSKISATVTEFQLTYPGANVFGIAADLAQVLKTAVAELGWPLEHIAYTAGDAFDFEPLSAVTAANAYASWTVLYLGPLLVGKLVTVNPAIYLKGASSSSITLTSGIHGSKPFPRLSKRIGWCGAVETLTRALAVDLAPIRVNNVSPGAIRTPMLEKLPDEAIAGFVQNQLVKEVGTVQQTAEAYLFSMRCSFATGQQFVIDGGYTYK